MSYSARGNHANESYAKCSQRVLTSYAKSREWKSWQIDLLKLHCGSMPVSDIARLTGKTESALIKKAHRIGLSIATINNKWTEEDIRLLEMMIEHSFSFKDIAEKLDRSEKATREYVRSHYIIE